MPLTLGLVALIFFVSYLFIILEHNSGIDKVAATIRACLAIAVDVACTAVVFRLRLS